MARKSWRVMFVTANGQITLSLLNADMSNICRTAHDLKARFFVAPYWGSEEWAVFSTRGMQKNVPHPGAWSIDDPVKVFDAGQREAAEMWAIHNAGRV